MGDPDIIPLNFRNAIIDPVNVMAPIEAPSDNAFSSTENAEQNPFTPLEALPLPAGGLPPGWTMEQWKHYGHQYQNTQDTGDGHNQK